MRLLEEKWSDGVCSFEKVKYSAAIVIETPGTAEIMVLQEQVFNIFVHNMCHLLLDISHSLKFSNIARQ